MEITCSHCQSKLRIPDERIPPGVKASFPCPKCKHKISVQRPAQSAPRPPAPTAPPAPSAAEAAGFGFEEGEEEYDDTERPFDFVEEEGKTAMVCTGDASARGTVAEALRLLEYHITEAVDARDALRKMRYHVYDVVVIDETFDAPDPDANGVLTYLERLNMAVRRNIFVVMLTRRFRTMDNMTAFYRSVNIIVNLDNMADVGKVLRRGITDHEYFYRVYKESLKKIMGV